MKTPACASFVMMFLVYGIFGQVFQHDTVLFEPSQPSNLDSITFKLYNNDHCCATLYHNQIIQIADTSIYLSYDYNDSSCLFVKCLVQGSWATFKSKPIASGKYPVYKTGSIYCPPGRICPALPVIITFVGTLVVTPWSLALPRCENHLLIETASFYLKNNTIALTLDKSCYGSIKIFRLDGTFLGTIFRGYLPQGSSRFSLGTLCHVIAGQTVIVAMAADNSTLAKAVFAFGKN